ncbi:MAG: FkbM family methyltransferase [Sideroxydans sp.]|jgi:FkbM family methyltransferase
MNFGMLKIATIAASLYKRLPVKPFSPLLQKLYFNVLGSGTGLSIVRKSIDSTEYEQDLREVIDSEKYYEGSREPATSQTLKMLCGRGHVVFDIGANVGSHTLPMASYVGETGRVYAFEPVPWATRKLKRNLELNDFKNINLEQIALSDSNSGNVEMEFRASFKIGSSSGVGADGKIDEGWWSECEKVNVPMITVDSYVAKKDIERLDLIKLDVDGFEGKVIRGGMETLKRFKPVLIMEIAPAWVEMRGDSMQEILYQLEQIGYKGYTEVDLERIESISQLIQTTPAGGGRNVVLSVQPLSSYSSTDSNKN